jgi:hypothetical protein
MHWTGTVQNHDASSVERTIELVAGNVIRHLLVIIFDKAKKRLVIECKKYLTKQNKEIKKMRDIISCGIV